MRDRRDYLIAGLAAALLFALGLLVGRESSILPQAMGQGTSGVHNPNDPETPLGGTNQGGISITQQPDATPGLEGRTRAETASDSDSNNRFVAVTSPIGSGESVLFLIDSKTEQVAVYRYQRRKGLEFMAGRKIEYDLKISGYQDISEFSHDEMKRLYHKQAAEEVAKSVKNKR
ncbi:MAG: hypothetical protein ACYTG3_00515 [Planctomycetota bacterium]|jgi:hypothetical protein